MRLKYDAEVRAIEECPTPSAAPVTLTAWRFVHADPADRRNFLPPAKIKPGRKFADSKECCSSLALSMFATQDQARAYFAELRGRYPQIHKAIGTHVAAGELLPGAGMATAIEGNGHFDFFEGYGVDLTAAFRCVGEACDAAAS